MPSHVSIPSHGSLHLQVLNRDRLCPGTRVLTLLGMMSPEIKWDLLTLCLLNPFLLG